MKVRTMYTVLNFIQEDIKKQKIKNMSWLRDKKSIKPYHKIPIWEDDKEWKEINKLQREGKL
jgi:hypothetical protein